VKFGFHVYRGNVSPLLGKKTYFGPLIKNNTGMAALRAGRPVTNNVYGKNVCFCQNLFVSMIIYNVAYFNLFGENSCLFLLK